MNRRRLLASALCLAGTSLVPSAQADPVRSCTLAGPAGSASVVRLDLPHGAPSLAMRITTSSALSPTDPSLAGGRNSWHLATEVALVRLRDGALIAHRELQLGSSPRRLALSAGGADVRADIVGPGLPFKHSAGFVPDFLGPGSYLLVAMGSDGDPALPNPGWSADAAFGAPVSCLPASVPTTVFDLDQSAFRGGTQVSAVGPGAGQGTGVTLTARHSWVVGMVDAASQAAGDVTVRIVNPQHRVSTVHNALRPFVGRRGTYRLGADWVGAVPLVLVAGVTFDPP
ncbi:MAG: hypothetical protein ABR549_14240 [Mycobacteriales bacterium]